MYKYTDEKKKKMNETSKQTDSKDFSSSSFLEGLGLGVGVGVGCHVYDAIVEKIDF